MADNQAASADALAEMLSFINTINDPAKFQARLDTFNKAKADADAAAAAVEVAQQALDERTKAIDEREAAIAQREASLNMAYAGLASDKQSFINSTAQREQELQRKADDIAAAQQAGLADLARQKAALDVRASALEQSKAALDSVQVAIQKHEQVIDGKIKAVQGQIENYRAALRDVGVAASRLHDALGATAANLG